MNLNQTIIGDSLTVLKTLPNDLADCCITSPPFWGLRNYGVKGQYGLEKTPEEYVSKMVEVFREVKRVLKKEGTCWLNLGDSYAGSGKGRNGDGSVGVINSAKQRSNEGSIFHDFGWQGATSTVSKLERGRGFYSSGGLKPKDLVGIPWRVAFALQADGWWLRQDIIWAKPNPMPESVTDRCTKSHEYVFLLTKSAKYYYDAEAVNEKTNDLLTKPRLFRKNGEAETLRNDTANQYTPRGTRNRRSVWTITTQPFAGAHFATFPEALIEPMIKAGCPVGGLVLDPFMGSGTTARVAIKLNRNWLGIELNEKYEKLIEKRTNKVQRVLLE